MKKLKCGARFIFTAGGVDSGRTGVIIPMRRIPISGHGIPRVPGAYRRIGAGDVAVQFDNGDLDVLRKCWISGIGH